MTDQPEHDDRILDGNAVGGILEAAFGRDMTAESGRCVHCGTIHVVAELRLYRSGPGDVLRCRACGGVVVRIVERGERVIVDRSGREPVTEA